MTFPLTKVTVDCIPQVAHHHRFVGHAGADAVTGGMLLLLLGIPPAGGSGTGETGRQEAKEDWSVLIIAEVIQSRF